MNGILVSGPLADALDVVSLVLLILGGVLSVAAGVGLLRFPDPLARMHAATKPQILGVILVLLALALQSQSLSTVAMLVPVLLFQMLTAPISAHMVGRAGYRLRHFLREDLLVDELEEAIDRAHDELREADEVDASTLPVGSAENIAAEEAGHVTGGAGPRDAESHLAPTTAVPGPDGRDGDADAARLPPGIG
ncbi:monovalent cation/H(+) antiporter subunit G [Clavibacter sepedonicus]|uniref:Na(+)/H(+) antiporter subunit n=1 Tax=Clavibacter sepedonicus TaxID=31964 RepID=B0RIN2_CLASE|nr:MULTISPECIES: monovalent cation/H(+) antiporter subunit G [Clavibacter]MBD5381685.1 monovalent cation/H(+) antiporter subunit G [Clavibacter sp.]OQJ47223.1 sodium:proton antiporter [Clavibacter sepedonicus]OQJ52781.1 sodium:proton antiporter [Clavibacter sepedonicus]UUK66773.1 monovalent cation/H(+) antiporter subunit G [Clavibacter sepedonicus]CAQ01523.1 putative Na(+)/H(+) antiporter subunit [Clavibacter sepedonicus]